MPLVSVILPTYNRADTILRAIESVQNQTLRDWELLVVDDGSTDDTAGLIAARYAGEPRLKLIRQENHGVSAARNAGLRANSGKYQDALALRVEVHDHHEGHAGVSRQTREQLLERFEAARGGSDADHRDQSVSDLLTFGALCVRVGPGAHLSGRSLLHRLCAFNGLVCRRVSFHL